MCMSIRHVFVLYVHVPLITVQSKDLQGHPYTLKNVYIRFSDPQLEPTPATKLQSALSEVVRNGVWEGKQPLVHYGSVTTNGISAVHNFYMYCTCTCMYIVHSSCSAQPGQHEACMCKCCPGNYLLKFLSKRHV